MDINFLETYTPSTLELDIKEVQNTRQALSQYATLSFPDVANAPGTVLGDLIITPQSYIISALQKGISNVLSDLVIENTANGIVYNCDFVKQYLKNFGVDTSEYQPSSGVVRLIFSENKEYILDRGTQFKLDNSIYSIYLPNDGDFMCLQSTGTLKEGVNGCVLKDTGNGSWFCDVPVLGRVGEVSITTGTSGLISQLIPELISVQALTDFSPGVLSDSIQNLAKKTQTTMFSASLNTRYGAVQYINTTCPFVLSAYALRDGDRELLRTYRNSYGIASGCLDVFVRSNSYQFTEKQQVKLTLNTEEDCLEGDWHYVGQPYHLESITHPAIDAKDLEDREIISYSDPSLKLGATAAYTKHEKFKIKLKNLKNAAGDSMFPMTLDNDGNLYTYVTVTYQTDPMFLNIAQTLENKDYAPINSNILVRGFIPVIISQFNVVYTKLPGIVPDLETAKDKIKIYLGNLGMPNQFSIAEIAQIMKEAGVNYIKNIEVTANVQWSIGDTIQNINGELEKTKVTEIRGADDLRVYYPNKDETITFETMYACSPKMVRYFLLENSINFNEVRDV